MMEIHRLNPQDARKTYNYLRLGLIGAALMLAFAVVYEILQVFGLGEDCFQSSISGYYYTPARAVFVGALMTVGLALIVIKGGGWEDTALNIAGLLAPVVALVPTGNVGDCWSVTPEPLPLVSDNPPVLANWVVANIDNNMTALLITAAVGVILIVILYLRDPNRASDLGTRLGLGIVAAIVLVAWVLFITWPDFDTRAHGFSAIAMFVFLAAAAAINGHRSWDKDKTQVRNRMFGVAYYTIAGLMALTAIVVSIINWAVEWDHDVLVLEATEILWFALYWLVQTTDHWHDPITRPAPVAERG